jgi:hypothetical protein
VRFVLFVTEADSVEAESQKIAEEMKEQAEARLEESKGKLAEADANANEPEDHPLTRDPSLSIETAPREGN